MNLWEKFDASFKANASRTAFCIGNRFYSFAEFTEYISGSQQLLLRQIGPSKGIPIGVMCHDTIETFAAIFAIWFSGSHFVPLHPLHPALINNEKIQQAAIQLVIDQEPGQSISELKTKSISNKDLKSSDPLVVCKETDRAYILFTSGSTGKPKGVPINEKNLNAFTDGFIELYPDLTSEDRFLQTYELTSDAAFTGYLIPLLLGAAVYTIPAGSFRYLSIVKILQEHQITWTQFTPSVLNYLRSYFKSLRFDSLRHSHFGGEALPYDLVSLWSECVPNAEISNIYGPTETTITCTIHRTSIDQLKTSVYNGIVAIGKPLQGVKIRIVDENEQVIVDGEKGELCIGGSQVMDGYLNSLPGDTSSFFMDTANGIEERYYRSGDIVFRDDKGCLYFCGRKDDQLKISGYRIEPAEIELAVSQLASGAKSKAYGFRNKSGTESIVVFVEQSDIQPDNLKDKLRLMLLPALIPEKIIAIRKFPLNQNGKVDKSDLFEQYSSQIYD
ncbi:MAG TPA: AMP-binding protein [Prolixibacteraceae bacterium]|jgi:amino acid adenylation domain-containing protein